MEMDELEIGADMERLKGRHILKHVLEANVPVDTILSLKNGKIGAHRIVLVAASPFLELLLLENEQLEVVTIILPDITKETMEKLLDIAYTGKLTYFENEAEELFSAMIALRFCEDAYLFLHKVLRGAVQPSPRPSTSRCAELFQEPKFPKTKRKKKDKGRLKNKENENPSVITPLVATVEQQSSQGSRVLSVVPQKIFNLLPSGAVQCGTCHRSYKSQRGFKTHWVSIHNSSVKLTGISDLEFQQITTCETCGVQYKNFPDVQKCLRGHGLLRCWVCLKVFSKSIIRKHYHTAHGVKKGKKIFVECRWCSKDIDVTVTTGSIVFHSSSCHFARFGDLNRCNSETKSSPIPIPTPQQQPSSKRSKRRREENVRTEGETLQLFKKSRFDGQLGSGFPPFFSGFNEKTGKIKFDMSIFPEVAVTLTEIPSEILELYTSKFDGSSTATASGANESLGVLDEEEEVKEKECSIITVDKREIENSINNNISSPITREAVVESVEMCEIQSNATATTGTDCTDSQAKCLQNQNVELETCS